MSYTYPANDAVDFEFSGDATYAYPDPSSVDVTWSDATSLVLTSTGFLAPNFGTPTVSLVSVGSCSTSIGTVSGHQFWSQVTLASSTVVSQAYYPFAQTCEATGFAGTTIGTPFSWSVTVSGGYLCFQRGKRSTHYGVPATPVDVTKKAHGFKSRHLGKPAATWSMFGVITRFGLPLEISTLQVAGFTGSALGQPGSRRRQPEIGSMGTSFGSAGVVQAHPAKGVSSTQFGHPAKSGVFVRAYSLRSRTRVSAAKAWQTFNYPASGMQSTTFGDISANETHRARHLPPPTRFGTPMRERPATC